MQRKTSLPLSDCGHEGGSIQGAGGLSVLWYKLYRANRTTKLNAEHFEAFASMNYPPLAESGVHLFLMTKPWKSDVQKSITVHRNMETKILLIKCSRIGEATFNHLLSLQGLKVILETFGSGNVTTESWFVNKLKALIERGIPVVNITHVLG